ncbi:DUF1385 domain-containing protein [Candidatus Woesearchaeota archaeon]|nr:DUF1385 domain-containing protein [Candidatus Woesearchaeota archaeon]
MKEKSHVLGGQAVIEGVMMKGRSSYAVAVRLQNGKIKTKTEKTKTLTKNRILSFPVIRGIVTLVELMVVGMKVLAWSADQQLEPEQEEKLSGWSVFFTILLSFLFAFLIFKLLPLGITKLIFFRRENQLVFNIVDGLIRIFIFFIYIWTISLFKDIRRVFEYHGAEHKTVYCFEAGKKLTVENVKRFSTRHPRCGTSFIMIVLVVSILIFSLVPVKLPFYLLLLYRTPLLLPIAGVSYELLKISFRFKDNAFFKVLIFPGLLFQRITTREPDKSQIEVAIDSAKLLLKKEKDI